MTQTTLMNRVDDAPGRRDIPTYQPPTLMVFGLVTELTTTGSNYGPGSGDGKCDRCGRRHERRRRC